MRSSFMRAALFYEAYKPLQIEDVEKPTPGPEDVIVEIKACGICHTDVSIVKEKYPLPRTPVILGHEPSGDVAEIGNNVTNVKVGDRVLVNPILYCGDCYYCRIGRESLCDKHEFIGGDRDGAFAEYLLIPAKNVFKIPEKLSYEEAAVITDAVATPFHALRRVPLNPGDTISIYGLGGLGMGAVMVAGTKGLRVIAVDIIPKKLDVAKELGAAHVINAMETNPVEKIKEFTSGEGVDAAYEFIGLKKTIEQCIDSVRKGGKIVVVGQCFENVEMNPRLFTTKEIEITGSRGIESRDFPNILRLVEAGKIETKKMISQSFPLKKVNKAIENLDKQIGEPIRIVIKL